MKNKKMANYTLVTLASLVVGAVCYKWIDKRIAYYFEFLPIPVKKQVTLISKLSAPEFVLMIGGMVFMKGIYLQRYQNQPLVNLGRYFYFPASLLLAWFLKRNLKYLITRKRPLLLFTNKEFGFEFFVSDDKQEQSFPSGHSVLIFALAQAAYRSKFGHPALVYPVAALLSLSRAPLNKHYISDIVGGAYMGYLVPELLLDLILKAKLPLLYSKDV